MRRCPVCGSDLIGLTTDPQIPSPHTESCFRCGSGWTRDGERVWDVVDERGEPVSLDHGGSGEGR